MKIDFLAILASAPKDVLRPLLYETAKGSEILVTGASFIAGNRRFYVVAAELPDPANPSLRIPVAFPAKESRIVEITGITWESAPMNKPITPQVTVQPQPQPTVNVPPATNVGNPFTQTAPVNPVIPPIF